MNTASDAGRLAPAELGPVGVVDDWLAGFRQVDGIYQVSPPRPFAHDEAQFDAGLRLDADTESIGNGLLAELRREGFDFALPALEIGCGSGSLSVGLARNGGFSRLILSDPSPGFLAILRRRLADGGVDAPGLRYAMMAGEDVAGLPAESFGLIALRHTVHHILDVEGFLRSAAAALRPGGFLVFEEPCAEALVLMAALCHLLPSVATARGVTSTATQLEQNDRFCRAIEFYSRRDVDKTNAEDKHLLRADEMVELGRRSGFDVRAHGNCSYAGLHFPRPEDRVTADMFSRHFRGYLENVIGFGAEFGELWDRTLSDTAAFVDRCAAGGTGPHYLATFVCRKR